MNTKVILASSLIAIFTVGLFADDAMVFAQYYAEGPVTRIQTSPDIVEKVVKKQVYRAATAESNPNTGLGVSIMGADDIFSSSVVIGTVFGSVAGALFVKGRTGKYAVMGRG